MVPVLIVRYLTFYLLTSIINPLWTVAVPGNCSVGRIDFPNKTSSQLYFRHPWFLTKFLKIAMLHVVVDRQKNILNCFRKGIFLCFVAFFIFFLCRKMWKMALLGGEKFFFEIGHIGYNKMRILCWFKKCKLIWMTVSRKKVKTKKRKQMGLSKIRKRFF